MSLFRPSSRLGTEDRCDGTLIRVREGVVSVRDFVVRRTALVRFGGSYLAPARQ